MRHALARGHSVTAVLRPGTEYVLPPGATEARADVLSADAIVDAARGCDAVISCLGIRRRSPRNPWSRLMSPPDFTSRAARAIVTAMRRARVERVLAISAAGVAESSARMSSLLRFLFAHSHIGDAYRDLAAMEAVYAASELDWTCVRPVTLVSRSMLPYCEVDKYALTATIPRETVATWLLDHVTARVSSRLPMIRSCRSSH